MNEPSLLRAEIERTKRELRWQVVRIVLVIVSVLAVLLVSGVITGVLPKVNRDAQATIQAYIATSTPTPTDTPTPTSTPTNTPTNTPMPTNTPTVTPTPTPEPVPGVATGNVYVRELPDRTSRKVGVLLRNDQVLITGFVEDWYRIRWGVGEGWVPQEWIGKLGILPESLRVTDLPMHATATPTLSPQP